MSRECRAIRPMLGALHDGEMNRANEERVRRHLAVCAECRRELAELEHLTGLARQAGPPELAEDYWDWLGARVQRRLAEHDQRPRHQFYRPSFVWPRVATLAGAMVVVLVVVLVGWQTMGPGLLRHGSVRRVESVQPNAVRGSEPAAEMAPTPEQKTEPVLTGKAGRASALTREDVRPEPAVAAGQEADQVPDVATVPEPVAATSEQTDKAGLESHGRAGSRGTYARTSARSRPAAPPLPIEHPAELPERLSAPPLPRVSASDTGTVLVEITTDDQGAVLAAAIRRSSGIPLLDSLAVQNARASRFRLAGPGRSFEYPFRFEPTPTKAHE